MNLWEVLRAARTATAPFVRFGNAASRIGAALLRWSPNPPAPFVERAAAIRLRTGTHRHRQFTEPEAVALFNLAAAPFQWRDRPDERRRWLLKDAGDRYIVRCLAHVDGIGGRRVRANSESGRWTLAAAMGEAFDEDPRTIERAWQRRNEFLI